MAPTTTEPDDATKGESKSTMWDGLIILYLLIGVNFLLGRLKDFSCETQALLSDMAWKHAFNLAGVYFLLVIFTRSAPIVHPAWLPLVSIGLYGIFFLITRCDNRFFVAFLCVLTTMFAIESWRSYRAYHALKSGDRSDDALLKRVQRVQDVLQIASLIIVTIGCVVYIGQHSREYASSWSWKTFWLGVSSCRGNGSPSDPRDGGIMHDLADGLRRILGLAPIERK